MDEFEHLSDAELEKIANPPASAAPVAPAAPADEFSHLSDAELEKIASGAPTRPTGQQPFSASLVPNRQALEAFGSRYLDVPTFGMATAARAGIGSLLHGTTYPEEYRRIKDVQARAQEAYPKTSTAGTVGGLGASLLAPSALYAPAIGGSRTLGAGLTGGLTGGIETYGETGGKPGAGLSDVGMGALYGAGFGTLGQRIGEAIPSIGQWFGRKVGALKRPPTHEEVKAHASDLYDQAKQMGIWIKPDKIRGAVHDLNDILANEAGFDPATHGDVARILKNMYSKVLPDMNGVQKFMPIDQLEAVRQQVNKGIMKSIDPQKKYMGILIKEHLDDVMNGLNHADVIGGDPQAAVGFLNQARPIWGRMRKAEKIEDAIELAKSRAASTYSGGNLDNAIRQEIAKLQRQGIKKPGTWSPEEMAAMDQVISGSWLGNKARWAGKALAPTGIKGLLELILGGGALATGNVSGALAAGAAAGVGAAAKSLSEAATERAAERLTEKVRAGTFGQRPMGTKALGQVGQAAAADLTSPGVDYDENGRRIITVTRPARAKGGRVCALDGCAARAHRDLANDLRPLMDQPDEAIAHALRLAKGN